MLCTPLHTSCVPACTHPAHTVRNALCPLHSAHPAHTAYCALRTENIFVRGCDLGRIGYQNGAQNSAQHGGAIGAAGGLRLVTAGGSAALGLLGHPLGAWGAAVRGSAGIVVVVRDGEWVGRAREIVSVWVGGDCNHGWINGERERGERGEGGVITLWWWDRRRWGCWGTRWGRGGRPRGERAVRCGGRWDMRCRGAVWAASRCGMGLGGWWRAGGGLSL